MEIIRVQAQKKTAQLRIAVYCRVSTKKEEQEESLETQKQAYTSLIDIRSDWKLVNVYSDSISGLSAEKRPGFMQMINDALAGKIDRILCKSVSRFSRNVVECKKYTDLLRIRNITVEFEKEHISTDNPTCSFMFALMSSIAENESRSISENVKWGYRERFKRGEYNLGNNRILGYDSVDGKLVPNKDAEIIRIIYLVYNEGASLKEIAARLNSLGYTGRNGKPLSEQGIMYILGNETYVGDKLLQKRAPKNFITKQPEKNVKFENNYLTDDHEAIIDRELWDAVQRKLKKRQDDIKNGVKYHGGRTHFLYGKVFCGDCGAPMTRRTLRGRGGVTAKAWTCRDRHLGREGNGCMMRTIWEKDLLADISQEMGYAGDEEFPVERFLQEVEKIEVKTDGIVVHRSVQKKFTA